MTDPTAPAAATIWAKITRVLLLFVPKIVQEAYGLGLLWLLVVVLALIFVAPPVVVGLASFSMQLLAKTQWKLATALRDDYLDYIYKGFGIVDVADKQAGMLNTRLDYFQKLEYIIRPSEPVHEQFSLQRGQHAVIVVKSVRLLAPDKNCKLLPGKQPLLEVYLGSEQLRTLREFDDEDIENSIKIDADWWKEHQTKFTTKAKDLLLRIEPTDFVKKGCGEVRFHGSLAVFKDLYVESTTSDKQ